MSRVKSALFRKKLHRVLGAVDDEGFCQLVWAVDAIQSNREHAGQRVMHYPARAVTSTLTDELYIPKWTLETLANEILIAPKRALCGRYFNFQTFDTMVLAKNLLLDHENADDGIALGKTDILQSLPRLGHRQFEWQRAHANVTDLYRSLYLFGGPAAAEYFQNQHGLAPHEFVLCGFAAYAMFGDDAAIQQIREQPEIGVSPELDLAPRLPLFIGSACSGYGP